jgi:hypothetical protein
MVARGAPDGFVGLQNFRQAAKRTIQLFRTSLI